MKRVRRVCLGVVTAAHGVGGEVRLRTFTTDPEAIAAYGPLENARGDRRFEIVRVRSARGSSVARIKGVDDRTQAEALRGTELWVDRDRLPDPDDDEWYVEDLKGLAVVDQAGNVVGQVRAVTDHGAGDVVEIITEDGKDLVLPFSRDQFPEVDPRAGHLVMAEPAFLEGGTPA